MKRTSYFSRVGVSLAHTKLQALFDAEHIDPTLLGEICHAPDTIPPKWRSSVYMALLMGWWHPSNFSFLREQLQQERRLRRQQRLRPVAAAG